MTFRQSGDIMRPQYTMAQQRTSGFQLSDTNTDPFPLESEIALLLNNVLEYGHTLHPSGIFRCPYDDGNGIFNEKDIRHIVSFLASHGLFCTPTVIPARLPGQKIEKYLAFNKTKEDLTAAFRYCLEAEALNKKSRCCQIL